jgi:hypothetical protein
MSNTYVDVSNTTSSNVKRSTDTDVNGCNTVNNSIYSGNFDTDLVYSEEEAPQTVITLTLTPPSSAMTICM